MKKLLALLLLPATAFAGALDVTADKLDIDQSGGMATFSGNVRAVRDNLTLTAAQAVVHYGTSKTSDIDDVVAIGNVVITKGEDKATGDKATYVPGTGKLVMTGGTVTLTRGGHSVQGTRLDYDTNAGQAQMQGGSGRVKAHFQSGGK